MIKKLTLLTAFAATVGLTGSAQAAEDSFLFGAPQKPQVFGSLGYSGIPRLGYMQGISPTVAIGGEFILDIGAFYSLGNGVAGNAISVAGAVPIKILLAEEDKVTFALTLSPGLGVGVPSGATFFELLLHSGVNIGYKASSLVTVGGGVDIPVTIFLGDASGVLFPILFGPAAEFRIAPQFSLRSELKLGPHIAAGGAGGLGGSTTSLGFKFNVGVNYRF
ncbi:MAG: hypothetical protein AAGD10_03430 [Myxococcota bacterium]